jgi:hypothetical protein
LELIEGEKMLAAINVLLGIGLLLAGRKLFWLFVAAGGFVAGVQLAGNFLKGPEWAILIIGLVTGILFAVLAVFLRAIAIGLAGFFLGGSILTAMAGAMGIQDGGGWIVYLIGGVIGILLVSLLFDWALITLSSFAGAALIVQTFDLGTAIASPIFLVLVIIGVWIQGTVKRREGGKHAN